MNTQPTPRTDEAAVDVWRKSNGERMETSSDKVDADFARCLERELNEARFDLDFSRRLANWQSKTIDDLTAQRDEAREQANDMHEKWLAKGQCCEYLGAELHEAIKQRDRLAEALRKVSRSWNYVEVAQQALQSLTPNAEP
jgi:chromosome segregation ATPase